MAMAYRRDHAVCAIDKTAYIKIYAESDDALLLYGKRPLGKKTLDKGCRRTAIKMNTSRNCMRRKAWSLTALYQSYGEAPEKQQETARVVREKEERRNFVPSS